MRVRDLIKLLKEQDPDRIVVMSSDPEGNHYSELSEIATGAYQNRWGGVIGLEPDDLDDDAIEEGYTEEDILEDGVPAVVLYPTN